MQVGRMAELRGLSYRLLSETFLYPLDERLEGLADACLELSQRKPWWDETPIRNEWKGLLQAGQTLSRDSFGRLRAQYILTFLASSGTVPCPIWESAYLGEDPAAVAFVLAGLEREYALGGVELKDRHANPLDHVATQMQFMAHLCGKEADAWEREAVPEACILLEQQARFLRRHLVAWFPRVQKRAEAMEGDSFYSTTISTAGAFLRHDLGLLDSLVARYQGALTNG